MKAEQIIKALLVTIAFALVAFLFLKWTDAHDKAMDASMTKYESCIKAEYGVTPASYYQQHGVTPTCK